MLQLSTLNRFNCVTCAQALVRFDFICACFFTINWFIWFWVAQDRLSYVFSLDSFVDFLTIVPSVILFIVNNVTTAADRLEVTGITVLRVFR